MDGPRKRGYGFDITIACISLLSALIVLLLLGCGSDTTNNITVVQFTDIDYNRPLGDISMDTDSLTMGWSAVKTAPSRGRPPGQGGGHPPGDPCNKPGKRPPWCPDVPLAVTTYDFRATPGLDFVLLSWRATEQYDHLGWRMMQGDKEVSFINGDVFQDQFSCRIDVLGPGNYTFTLISVDIHGFEEVDGIISVTVR